MFLELVKYFYWFSKEGKIQFADLQSEFKGTLYDIDQFDLQMLTNQELKTLCICSLSYLKNE